jgi:hypothetical protein
MMRARTLLVTGLLLACEANAAEMLSVEVDYQQGVYSMRSEVLFDASIEQVFEVFRRWDYSAEFSSVIIESRDVAADDLGRPRFYVKNRACVLFFCKTFERRGYVELESNVLLRAFTLPDVSDFHRSDESWDFASKQGGTVVTYHLEMKPKFWIPPGIGPYFIKRKLKHDGGRAIDRIEAIARAVRFD